MELTDIVGKSFTYPINNNHSFHAPGTTFNKPQRLRNRAVTRTAETGEIFKFTQLVFVPGFVTTAGLRSEPILTGYMTGCYLFRYRKGGVMRVAHVGTDSENLANTQHVKRLWRNYVGRTHINEVMGFNPTRDISDGLWAQGEAFGTAMSIFGAFAANGDPYSGVICTDKPDTSRQVIIGIEKSTLQPWRSLESAFVVP